MAAQKHSLQLKSCKSCGAECSTPRAVWCRPCNAKYHREYTARRRASDPAWHDSRKAQKREWRKNNLRHALQDNLYKALKRCPTDNPATPDQLVELYHQQKGLCALTGWVMTLPDGSGNCVLPTSMTMDKINADGAYTLKNIRLVCHAVNSARGRMSDEGLLALAKAIVRTLGGEG